MREWDSSMREKATQRLFVKEDASCVKGLVSSPQAVTRLWRCRSERAAVGTRSESGTRRRQGVKEQLQEEAEEGRRQRRGKGVERQRSCCRLPTLRVQEASRGDALKRLDRKRERRRWRLFDCAGWMDEWRREEPNASVLPFKQFSPRLLWLASSAA